MIAVWILAIALMGWYMYIDWLASTIVALRLPQACVRCNATDKLLTTKVFSQSYGISFDNDALDEIFPVAYRAATTPICHECKKTIEHESDIVYEAGCNAGLISTVIVAILIWYPIFQNAQTGLTGIGKIIWITFLALGMGAFVGLIVGLIAQAAKSIPQTPQPVKFTLRGNISFTNPEYASRFHRFGESKNYRFKQKAVPHTIFFGLLIFIIVTLLNDLGELSAIHPDQRISLQIVVALKALAILMFFKSRVWAFGIWLPVFFYGLYLNQENAMENLDDFAAGIVIALIIIYEWWQTHRDNNHSLAWNEINHIQCRCGQNLTIVREKFIYDYLTETGINEKTGVINIGRTITASCPQCSSKIFGF